MTPPAAKNAPPRPVFQPLEETGAKSSKGWKMVRLGEITSASTQKDDPLAQPNVPYIGLEHIERDLGIINGQGTAAEVRSTKSVFQKGDLLYGKLRPYLNKVWVAQFDGMCSTDILVYPKTDSVDNAFLRYRFMTNDFVSYASENSNGVNLPRVNAKVLARFPLLLPPLAEQKQIVSEIEKQFTRLEAGVSALKRVQTNLKRYRAAVLKAACEGKLVPTEAELHKSGSGVSPLNQSRDGSATLPFETGAQLLARVLEERRKNWLESNRQSKIKNRQYREPAAPDTTNLPPLPEGWTWAKAEQICEFITKGTTPSAEKMQAGEGEIPYIKVYNLTFTGVLNSNYKPVFISRKTHEVDLSRSEVRPGDILINIVGPPLGQVSIVPPAITEANINQAIARFRVVLPDCRKLLGILLMAEPIIAWAIKRAKTTAGQSNLTLEHCRDLPIPLPPLAEQTRIVAEVERRLSVVEELETLVSANLQRATRLRQSILQKAFTGEL